MEGSMVQTDPFTHSHGYLGRTTLRVDVHGYLDTAHTREYLDRLTIALRRANRETGRPIGMLFQEDLSGFDVGTVAMMHAEWFRKFGELITGVAIVSSKLTIRFGVAAAKLVAKRPIKLFDDEPAAREWLDSLYPKSRPAK
jgi:SpoIIAA-like